jgi:hypothetical protein
LVRYRLEQMVLSTSVPTMMQEALPMTTMPTLMVPTVAIPTVVDPV